jgi:Cu/Ag efflux pump CusA
LPFLSAVVRWSLLNRPIVLVATTLFIAVGLRAATQLPIDAVPDITNVQVQIITAAPSPLSRGGGAVRDGPCRTRDGGDSKDD